MEIDGQEVPVTRLSVYMNLETGKALRDLSAEMGVTQTEVVRRAVAVLRMLKDEQDQGRKIQTMNSENKERREIVLT